jgi:hypothetical protein
MTPAIAPAAVYLLCLLTSVGCALLLVRAYLRTRTTLLLWTALCFVLLAVNNLLLVCDLLVFPGFDLRLWRHLTAFAAVSVLLYGFIRETN